MAICALFFSVISCSGDKDKSDGDAGTPGLGNDGVTDTDADSDTVVDGDTDNASDTANPTDTETTTDDGEACDPGFEGCECYLPAGETDPSNGLCDGVLECVDGYCVDPGNGNPDGGEVWVDGVLFCKDGVFQI